MTQFEKHCKALKVLFCLRELDERIAVNEKTLAHFQKEGRNPNSIQEHYKKRIEIENAKKRKLENYYKNNFKL